MAEIILHQSSTHMSLSTSALFDKTLSYKAKGLLVQMFSISKNEKWQSEWQWSVNGLCALATDGKSSVDSAIHELEEHGYLVRKQRRTADGRASGYDYHVFEEPFTDFPETEKPITENQPQYNNKKNNNKKNTIVKENPKEVLFDDVEVVEAVEDDRFEEFWNAYDKKCGKDACMKIWAKLSAKDRAAAIAYIPGYKEAQPDKQYRKHPSSYLHQKAWKDEIVKSNQQQKQQSLTGNAVMDEAMAVFQFSETLKL